MWRKTLSGTPDTLTMDCRNHLYIAARNSSLLEVARLLGTAEGRELINKDDGSGDVGLLCLLTYISDRKRIEVCYYGCSKGTVVLEGLLPWFFVEPTAK